MMASDTVISLLGAGLRVAGMGVKEKKILSTHCSCADHKVTAIDKLNHSTIVTLRSWFSDHSPVLLPWRCK